MYMEPSHSCDLVHMLGQTFSNAAIAVYEQVSAKGGCSEQVCAKGCARAVAGSRCVQRDVQGILQGAGVCRGARAMGLPMIDYLASFGNK